MQRRHRAAHLRIWLAMAVALPVILVAALAMRRNGPNEAPPVLLSAPSPPGAAAR